jgi:hypothetical protein
MKSNEQYMSLYDYRGASSRESGLGQKVYEAAKKKDIHVIYTDLPQERATSEYNRVATYPKWFLDEYFGKPMNANMSIHDVYLHLIELKRQFDELITNLETNVTDSNERINKEYDDELPF